jgi:hypothetical protein
MKNLFHILRILAKSLLKLIIAIFLTVQFFATLTGPDNAREACYVALEQIDQLQLCSMFDLRSMRSRRMAAREHR